MLLRCLAVALVALVASVNAGCSSDDDARGPTASRAATTTSVVAPVLRWNIDGVYANATNPPTGDVTAAVHTTLDAYLALAVVEPLHTGEPAGDLSSVLSTAARDRLASDAAARATLLDEGLPPMTSITAERARATLSSVAGPDGAPAVIGAQLDLALRATGPTLDIDIVRAGEVVLVSEGGGWVIDSFVLTTKRDSRP